MSAEADNYSTGLESFGPVEVPTSEPDRRPSGPEGYGKWPEDKPASDVDTPSRRPSGPEGYGTWPSVSPMGKLFDKSTHNAYKIGYGMPSWITHKKIMIMMEMSIIILLIALVVMIVLYTRDHKQLKQLQYPKIIPTAVS